MRRGSNELQFFSTSQFRGGYAIETYSVRIQGRDMKGPRISAAVLKDLIEILVDGSRGAVRLRVEGRSSAPGALPSWLAKAADFDLVKVDEGSTVLRLEAPSLTQAAPERFGQGALPFADVEAFGSRSCLDLLSESLREALSGRTESDLFDTPLLATFEQFSRLLYDGTEQIEIRGGTGPEISLNQASFAEVRDLIGQTPAPQQVRLAGRLDMIRHSDSRFTLVLESGDRIPGTASLEDPQNLASLWGQPALVEGTAVFRPSGSILRVDADYIEAAQGDVSIWSRPPQPVFSPLQSHTLRQPQGPRSGLAAVIGKWPGEETEDEFLTAVAELS